MPESQACPSWQWHRTGSRGSPVGTLSAAPCGVTWDSSRTVVVVKLRRTPALTPPSSSPLERTRTPSPCPRGPASGLQTLPLSTAARGHWHSAPARANAPPRAAELCVTVGRGTRGRHHCRPATRRGCHCGRSEPGNTVLIHPCFHHTVAWRRRLGDGLGAVRKASGGLLSAEPLARLSASAVQGGGPPSRSLPALRAVSRAPSRSIPFRVSRDAAGRDVPAVHNRGPCAASPGRHRFRRRTSGPLALGRAAEEPCDSACPRPQTAVTRRAGTPRPGSGPAQRTGVLRRRRGSWCVGSAAGGESPGSHKRTPAPLEADMACDITMHLR